MSKVNWDKAPKWARYSAVDSFSGLQYWSQTEPKPAAGWVEIEERIERAIVYGHDYADVVSPTVLAQKDGNGVYHIVSHDVTDHAAELAEALESVLDRICSREYDYDDFSKAGKALYKYKQSRGEHERK